MSSILTVKELRQQLRTVYSKCVLNQSKQKRLENIDAFLEIDRMDLECNKIEKRVLLYQTNVGEKIYIQYPGSESARSNGTMPKDFRPELQLRDGRFIPPVSFGLIWDILDNISYAHRDYLDIVSTILYRMAYMKDYELTNEEFDCTKIDISNKRVLEESKLTLKWNRINFSKEIWESLNNYIGEIELAENMILSFEGFIKFFDLLIQNEDCKYYYKNYIVEGKKEYRKNLANGRINTIHAQLVIISYLVKEKTLSELLNAFQKARGVPHFNKRDYPLVSKGLIDYI